MKTEHYDVIVIGAGVIGLTVARELALRNAGRILVLEKERQLGAHASGRNTGVLHAGIYYTTDSLKGRMCSAGARLWRQYATQHDIPCSQTGKVIVAQDKEAIPRLEVLATRARANGVCSRIITARELSRIEPEARTTEIALHSPETAVIDTHMALAALRGEIVILGVDVQLGTAVRSIDCGDQSLTTNHGHLTYDYLFNCAGLHADQFAHMCGVGQQYRIIHFRGSYKELSPELAHHIRGSIYPTPDPRLPFLGVHVTRTIDGSVSIGPTAFPAFGREHYHGLSGIRLGDALSMGARLSRMFIHNTDGVRTLMEDGLRKRLPGAFTKEVQTILPFVSNHDIHRSSKRGLRAQLVNVATNQFVMDFVVERGPSSTHVLNAVSPGFTCAFPFATHVVNYALGVIDPVLPHPTR